MCPYLERNFLSYFFHLGKDFPVQNENMKQTSF